MDEKIIENWNKKVKPNSVVYHVGDFAFVDTPEEFEAYLKRLNGHIHLIVGNHDEKRIDGVRGFESISLMKDIRLNKHHIVLCHYAMKTWRASHRGAWQLFGHSHGTLERDYGRKQLDVGVDCWNFTPISYGEVAEELKKHRADVVDHHGED